MNGEFHTMRASAGCVALSPFHPFWKRQEMADAIRCVVIRRSENGKHFNMKTTTTHSHNRTHRTRTRCAIKNVQPRSAIRFALHKINQMLNRLVQDLLSLELSDRMMNKKNKQNRLFRIDASCKVLSIVFSSPSHLFVWCRLDSRTESFRSCFAETSTQSTMLKSKTKFTDEFFADNPDCWSRL